MFSCSIVREHIPLATYVVQLVSMEVI